MEQTIKIQFRNGSTMVQPIKKLTVALDLLLHGVAIKRVSYRIPGGALVYCFKDGTKTIYPVR